VDDINDVIQRIRDGERISDIAAERGQIWHELRREIEDVVGAPADDKDAIKERVRKGETLESIAREYCVSRQAIHDLTRDVGKRYDNRAAGRTRASKLTPRQVLAMRRAYAAGATYDELGERYGVTAQTAQKAVRGETYKNVAAVNIARTQPVYRTPEGLDLIARLRDEGRSWVAIADQLGLERGTLRDAVAKLRPELLERAAVSCAVCGQPTWSKYGVCWKNPDCAAERARRSQRAKTYY
jgi:ribosomal protein L17